MALVDYSKIRAGIDIQSVLARYNIETRKVSNSQLKSDCPLVSHKTAAHDKGTFSVSLDKAKWYCHSDSCRAASGMPKGGDAIDLVRLLDGCTVLDAAKKLVEWYPHLNDDGQPQREGAKILPPSKPLTNPPLAFTLKDVIPTHKMLADKGISEQTAKEFGVGFFGGKGSMANRIVFPLYEADIEESFKPEECGGKGEWQLIGYAGRTVVEVTGDNPKWRLPKGLHMTFLYGLERCNPYKNQPLMLCESPWGVLHFHQHHQQAAAIIGTNLTEAQEALLKPFKTICVAMDDDQPGREAAQKIATRLKELGHKVWKATLLE